jgi:hypothetical protein
MAGHAERLDPVPGPRRANDERADQAVAVEEGSDGGWGLGGYPRSGWWGWEASIRPIRPIRLILPNPQYLRRDHPCAPRKGRGARDRQGDRTLLLERGDTGDRREDERLGGDAGGELAAGKRHAGDLAAEDPEQSLHRD